MAPEKIQLWLPSVPEKEPVSVAQVPRDVLVAMGRVVGGVSTAERLTKMHSLEDFDLTQEVRSWAEERLFTATEKWQKFNHLLDHPLPNDSYGLNEMFPDLSETLMHMHETVTKNTEFKDPHTEILFIPYADMLKNIDDLPGWLSRLRAVSGLNSDHIHSNIRKRISDETQVLQFIDRYKEGLSFKSNLEYHVHNYGEWGLLLVADTIESETTVSAHREFPIGSVENHNFDYRSYGIAEWIADTLQRDERSERRILLPASKIVSENLPESVAYGSFDKENQRYQIEIFPIVKKPAEVDVVPTYGIV